jgi:FAD-NAD(P)-binding protein
MASDRGLVEVAIVGAGPTASSLLERLTANAPELLGGRRLRVHVVDPHRAGTGRVWRPDLHPRLWMNSMAEDVTMFTDASVRCDGPIRSGPSLYEWAHSIDDGTLTALAPPSLIAEIRGLGPMTFPTRLVQSVYLDWFHQQVTSSLPDGVEVCVHNHLAIDVADDPDGRQRVVLDGADAVLRTDSVVLALGHLDAEPDPHTAELSSFAAERGLIHLPPGHTAELDLSALSPGADVVALGFGQAFTDLLVLLTEGRGGRFVDSDQALRYEPSGREPIVHVGSRRGVPYRSKLTYRLQGPPAPLPTFLGDRTIDELVARQPLDFRHDVLPLVVKEISWAYYHELFSAHPDRTAMPWERFASEFTAADPTELDGLVVAAVPDRADRFDVARLDRPLAGLSFGSADELHRHIVEHIAADVARRTDPEYSADLGAFNALLSSFAAVGRLVAAGALTPRSRVETLDGCWFSFFMYYASGPPPDRLRQLLALAEAGLVRFIGADATVVADPASGTFAAVSTSHPDLTRTRAVVDARIAVPSLSRTTAVLLRRLHERGDAVEEVVADDDGWHRNTGKVAVTADLRMLRADGSAHPYRHALGAFTSRPAAGAFARPNTNAPAFRQNDAVARAILVRLAAIGGNEPADAISVAS